MAKREATTACGPSCGLVQGKEAPTEEEWREYLADRLPASMIPSAVIAIDAIPLSQFRQSGQGRSEEALLAAGTSPGEESEPQAGLEAEIARLWSESAGPQFHSSRRQLLLARWSQPAGDCRGTSPRADARPSRARSRTVCGTHFARLRQPGEPIEHSCSTDEEVSSDRATEGQREFWVAEQAGLDTRGFNIPLILTASRQSSTLAQWRSAWAALVVRHDALRTGFQEDADGVLRRSVRIAVIRLRC